LPFPHAEGMSGPFFTAKTGDNAYSVSLQPWNYNILLTQGRLELREQSMASVT